MKKLITLLLLCPIVLFGQAAGGNDPVLSDEAGIGEIIEQDPVEAAEEKLASKKWLLGWNEQKKEFIAIGTGAIQVPSNHPAFSTARKIAFQKARLDAQTQFVEYMSQEVSRHTISIYEEPSTLEDNLLEIEESGTADPGIIDKTKMLIHAELDEALAKKGISPKSDQAIQLVEEILVSDKFKDTITAAAKAEAAGMFIYDIFESAGNQQTAVIGIISDNTKKLAGAILGKNPSPPMKAKGTIADFINDIPVDDMLATYGVKTRPDENGNLYLISFGQATPRTNSPTAKTAASKKARLNALGDLRSFAGEMVAVAESGGDSSSFEELSNGVANLAIESSYKKTIDARASTLSIPGIQTVKNWSTVDPRSGEQVVGVVLRWSLGDAMSANVLRDQMSNLGGSKGGAGTSNIRPKPAPSSSNSKKQTINTSPGAGGFRSGADSDDDDF